jgi:hypothetical protein
MVSSASAMRRLGLAIVLLGAPVVGVAQQSTADNIKRAIDMYNNFNIEGARPILLNIISPNYVLQVTPEQRVTAYKYLGASYAVLDKPDSAITFFMAALDFDPFTDLSTTEFSAAEQNAFSIAKQRLFKVAIRPITPHIIDSTYRFRLITTHRSSLTITLADARDTSRSEVLFQGESDGPRDIGWNGLLRSGQRADSTLYEFRVQGTSRVQGGSSTTERQLFRVEHVYEPLEDTLPSIPASDLLQEQYRPSAPWLDLIKGTSLAMVAVGLPYLALSKDRTDLSSWETHTLAAGGVALGSAVIAFIYRRGHRSIPANVRENTRREAERSAFNAAVRARNAARINATTLLICPPTGCPR